MKIILKLLNFLFAWLTNLGTFISSGKEASQGRFSPGCFYYSFSFCCCAVFFAALIHGAALLLGFIMQLGM